ncbi:MAG: aldo/keto reductase [Opitutaceae bacterium]|nr:aldo/keto reductase [Opitutaceae bacterium]MBP9912418.1 aldo/keto reductase [Opitutaceae bacterium]
MTTRLGWGILATGRIAGIFAQGVARSQHSRLVAVGSRTAPNAARFAKEFGVPRAHGSYEALLADPEVQAVYIAVPHPQHVEWAVRAAEAGKHILCEKPIGLNHAELMVMAEAARANNVLLMEAFMYRCHPQTAKIVEIVRSGVLGEIRLVQAAFGFNAGFNATSRLWSNAAAGGGILDVGCYTVSMARLIAGAISGVPFLDPVAVSGSGQLHPETGVDMVAAGTLKFANGLVAQVSTSVGVTQDNSVRIYGTAGMLHVPSPWIPPSEGAAATMTLSVGGKTEEISIMTPGALYGLEADAVAVARAEGKRETTAMSVADSLGNMAALDAWRAAIGLTYEQEQPKNFLHTHTRRPLRRRADAVIPTGRIAHLDKPVSRLIYGCDNQITMAHGAAVWDDYYERGGLTFDTAYVYGGGLQERIFGQWVKNRGLREEVSVIVKGAHTPNCNPEDLVREFHESLGRLQFDYADIYMLHRDNLEVPIGEFVEVLNAQVRAGRIRTFGGSNWTIERIAAANRYARRKGLQGFSVLSNNFSLARMVDPVWDGCISASDAESRRWLKKNQLPLFAWSSQARGFFTDRAGRDKRDDEQLVRCWYSDDNFERRERAIALAKKKGTTPIAIAAAYVLAQPFPTFALIGPRLVSEMVSSLPCLSVELSPRELAWLNLERAKP